MKDAVRGKGDGKSRESFSTSLSPWTAIGALSIVIALILVVARMFRKHAPMFQHGLPSEAVEILGRRFVDQRQSIVLVRIASRILVVGSSPNGLHSLGTLDDPLEVDLVAGLCRRDSNAGGVAASFLSLFKRQTFSGPAMAAGRARAPLPGARASQQANAEASISRPPGTPAIGNFQPEYNLRQRLREAQIPLHQGSQEAVDG